MKEMLRLASIRYLSLGYALDVPLEKDSNLKRSIESFGRECVLNFRFECSELKQLLLLLRFPLSVIFINRLKMPGEEVFLRGLYELKNGSIQYNISKCFGRDTSAQSRAFRYFVDHVYDNFHHLVHNNLEWWKNNGFWKRSAELIDIRMNDRHKFTKKNLVSHFIDCNCLPTSRCGGGPAEAGANSARWNDNIQRAFYNGWKSIHGLKHQTVDNAFGFTEDMFGPCSLRHNDLILLRESDINMKFKRMQTGELNQYIIFGDSAYGKDTHLSSYHQRDHLIEDHIKWNKAMKHVRISIEWNYGSTATLFKYVRKKDKLKLLGDSRVSKIYTVATLFRNFHNACYGSQCSMYFNAEMPVDMLSSYVNQTEVDWVA